MRCRIPASGRRRGAAAVELAILLPTVLVPLMMGIWELGRLVQAQQILGNAVREGARQASTGKKTNSQVSQAVVQYLTDAGLKTTDASNNVNAIVTVTNVTSGLDAASANQLDHMTISVSLPYDNVRWTSLNFFITSGTTVQASADWYSMKDIPLTVSATIPAMPQ
jgi:Flp pilus assembly protein TadG